MLISCFSCSTSSGIPLVGGGGGLPRQVGERREVPRPDFDDDPLRVGPPQHPRIPDGDNDPLRVGPPRRPGQPIRDPDPL